MRSAPPATLLLLAAAVAMPAAALPHQNLIGAWEFDEVGGQLVEDTMHAHDGYLGSSPFGADPFDPTRVSPGLVGSGALSFGGDDYVTIPSVVPTPEITIAMWTRISPGTSSFHVMGVHLAAENACAPYRWFLYTGDFSAESLQFNVENGQSVNGFPGFHGSAMPNPGIDIFDGEWHLLVGTYDGFLPRLYIDGVEQTTNMPPPAPVYSPLPTDGPNGIVLGDGGQCDGGDWFIGQMDQVTLWDSALNPDEVTEIHGDPGYPVPELATLLFAAAGLAVVAVARRR